MTCHPASHCATGLLALVHAQSRYLVSTIEADEAASLRGPYLGILRTINTGHLFLPTRIRYLSVLRPTPNTYFAASVRASKLSFGRIVEIDKPKYDQAWQPRSTQVPSVLRSRRSGNHTSSIGKKGERSPTLRSAKWAVGASCCSPRQETHRGPLAHRMVSRSAFITAIHHSDHGGNGGPSTVRSTDVDQTVCIERCSLPMYP